MSTIKTPQASDWNNYWSLDQTQKFTRISWSKKRIMRIIRPYVFADSLAMDAGCGSGFFSKYFCDHGMDVTALDYSEEALQIAKKMTEGNADLIQMDLVKDKALAKTDERYDLIFTDGLLEHFSSTDQDAIVNNLKSLLSDNGVLITFVPNRWSPWELIRPFFMPGIEEDPFTMKRLLDVNARNGLDVLAQGGINTVPFAFSPDSLFGSQFGMLLYTIAKNK